MYIHSFSGGSHSVGPLAPLDLFKLDSTFKTKGLQQQLPAGVVLTGGAAQIEGLVGAAEQVFDNIQVRIGVPDNLEGLSEDISTPAYSTALGLLRYKNDPFSETREVVDESRLTAFVSKFKSWIKKEY